MKPGDYAIQQINSTTYAVITDLGSISDTETVSSVEQKIINADGDGDVSLTSFINQASKNAGSTITPLSQIQTGLSVTFPSSDPGQTATYANNRILVTSATRSEVIGYGTVSVGNCPIHTSSTASGTTKTPDTPAVMKSVLGSNGKVEGSPYALEGQELTFQLEAPLPNPELMNGNYQYFIFKDVPEKGITIANVNDPSEQSSIKIGSVPLSTLLTMGGQVTGSSTDSTIQGNGSNYWMIELSQKDIEYLEQHGVTGASSIATAGTQEGLKLGDQFAVTYTGTLNGSASPSGENENTAFDAYSSSITDAAAGTYSIKSTDSTVNVSLFTPIHLLPMTGGRVTRSETFFFVTAGLTAVLSGGAIIAVLRKKRSND